jgi:Mlc titration factor MtfA (ptsG expression regulator)
MEGIIAFVLFIGLLIFIFLRWATRKSRLRKKVMKRDFPTAWRKILLDRVGFYHTLSDEGKRRFERGIQVFLSEKRIIGLQTEVDELSKVLVAASAIIPVWGFENWEYPNLAEIYITDGAISTHEYKEEGQTSVTAGQIKPRGGRHTVTLSKSALEQGFSNMADRKNVGIHEFTHMIDEQDGAADGIPENRLPDHLIEPWTKLMYEKMEEIKQGENKINSYGATSETEFFAVVTEYFFEKPGLLQEKHPQLYDMLTKIFNQKPHRRFPGSFKELLNPYGKKTGRNDPCPCGSGEKFKHCCGNN